MRLSIQPNRSSHLDNNLVMSGLTSVSVAAIYFLEEKRYKIKEISILLTWPYVSVIKGRCPLGNKTRKRYWAPAIRDNVRGMWCQRNDSNIKRVEANRTDFGRNKPNGLSNIALGNRMRRLWPISQSSKWKWSFHHF